MFTVLFEIQQKFAKNGPKETITFSHFCKTQVIKNGHVPSPLLNTNWCFKLHSLKNIDVEQKQNFKSGKNNKIRKRDLKEKTANRKTERIDEKLTFTFNILMLFFAWNKSRGRREVNKRQNQGSKIKQKRKYKKEGRKQRTLERERDIYIYI